MPLPRQAVEILHAVRRLSGRFPYLFHSVRSTHKPMNANTMLPSSAALFSGMSPLGGKTKVKNPQSTCIEFGGVDLLVRFEERLEKLG